ncbi:hypothetical protein [Blastococcus aggregatus]|nr:hypothetical protein [Blastococcus aggregatus]
MLHRIVPPGIDDEATEFSTDDLETVTAHLATTHVAVRTIGDVARCGI